MKMNIFLHKLIHCIHTEEQQLMSRYVCGWFWPPRSYDIDFQVIKEKDISFPVPIFFVKKNLFDFYIFSIICFS